MKTKLKGANPDELSSVEPEIYRERFCNFLRNYVILPAHYLTRNKSENLETTYALNTSQKTNEKIL